jgi:hypothetical protein
MGELSFFSSGGSSKKGSLYSDFLAHANKAAGKRPFDKQHLYEVIKEVEFKHNVYEHVRHAQSLIRVCDKFNIRHPYRWSDDYIEFMATFKEDEASETKKIERDGLIALIRAGKATIGGKVAASGGGGASGGAVKPAVKPAASGGAVKPAVKPAASGGRVKAVAQLVQGQPPASGGAAKPAAPSASNDIIVVGTKDTKKLAPPTTIYVVKPEDEIIFLAVPSHENAAVPDAMGALSPTFFRFKDFMQNKEQNEATTYPQEVFDFFKNFIGFNNLQLCGVRDAEVKIKGLPEDLSEYVVSRTMVRKYMQVGVNQYEDHEPAPAYAPRQGPITMSLTEALKSFTDERKLRDYFQELEKMYEVQQEQRRREEQEKIKKTFIDKFFGQEFPDDITFRHEEYIRLKNEGVITEKEYLDLCEEHCVKIMKAGGVMDTGGNLLVEPKKDVKEFLGAFTPILGWVTPSIIDAYLDERDKILKLREDAGDIRFNEQFEQENRKTLKQYVQDSQVPGLWPLFETAYKNYIRNKELVDSIREAARKVAHVPPNAAEPGPINPRPVDPPSPPRGDGGGLGYSPTSPDFSHAKKKARRSADSTLVDQAPATFELLRGERNRKPGEKFNPRAVSNRASRTQTRNTSPAPGDN